MAQNLQTYAIKCPECEGTQFARGTLMDLGPNGLIERKGDYICLECKSKLSLEVAVRRAERQRKLDDLRAMEEEIESMTA